MLNKGADIIPAHGLMIPIIPIDAWLMPCSKRKRFKKGNTQASAAKNKQNHPPAMNGKYPRAI